MGLMGLHPSRESYSIRPITATLARMPDYALLVLPAMNRVYAEAAVALTQAELMIFNETVLGNRLQGIAAIALGGIPYIRFSADVLDDGDVAYLSNLSSLYALFELQGSLLRPLHKHPLDKLDDDLITIQKYSGKTNEHFTKLLLNVTILSSAFGPELLTRKLSVFDPLCGRGTTLNQALVYGCDAAGMDIDRRDVEAYQQFTSTYLKRKHLKHTIQTSAIREEKKVVGMRFDVELAATKESWKAGETQKLTVINADTTRAGQFFKPASFDVVAADLPYGVLHGSRSSEKHLARRPLDLLTEALPVWRELLRPGGAIGLAWNTHVAGREKFVQAVEDAGFEVLPYTGFRHVVDQSITRDIVVARKT